MATSSTEKTHTSRFSSASARPAYAATEISRPPATATGGPVRLSQYVEQTFAEELLEDRRATGVGYLLKDRVGDVEEFMAALTRVADGGTVVGPEVVRQLLARRRDPLSRLTPREHEVLGLMAEGRSNAALARALVVTEAAVAKHIANILLKLDLPPAPDDHRRVRAVLAYLRA
ncbi:response regulator transcription factor [Streptomyces sp. NPDC057638]|uniref:response regulator transcription factor n=1 Tax=Streptomyces sp. NPDC057638 TaxID=3346190 RepID=UPI00368ADEBD